MNEASYISDAFLNVIDSPEFDDFLMKLINYFHWFLEKRYIDLDLDSDSAHIEQSLIEIEEYRRICGMHYMSEKCLACSYSILVLGNANYDEHHMKCGKSFTSNSERDAELFESLFSFCSSFVWITFRRKDFLLIETEVNRLFRSDFFNPSIHEIENELEKPNNKKTVPFFSRINYSSPIIISLFSTSNYISKCSKAKLDKSNKCKLIMPRYKCERYNYEELVKLVYLLPRVGIVGEPLHLYSLFTLAPLEDSPTREQSNTVVTSIAESTEKIESNMI